jgi:hypothetical protein
MDDRYSWPSDKLNYATYKWLVKNRKDILSATNAETQPDVRRYYRDALDDAVATLVAVRNQINDITNEAKRICGISKCNTLDKSKCMNVICTNAQWMDMITAWSIGITTNKWRGISNSGDYKPLTIEDLIEIRITARRNAAVFGQSINDALEKLGKSVPLKFKRMFKNIRGSEEHSITMAVTICLILVLALALLHFIVNIYNQHNLISAINTNNHIIPILQAS